MVDLVLNDARGEPGEFFFLRAPGFVRPLGDYGFWPLHVREHRPVRGLYGQTAFAHHDLPFRPRQNFRIDDLKDFSAALLGKYQHAKVHADLRRGKAGARLGTHDFLHHIKNAANFLVDAFDGFRALAKTRIADKTKPYVIRHFRRRTSPIFVLSTVCRFCF